MDVGLNLRDLMSSGRLPAMFETLGVSRFEAAGVLAFFYEATQDAEMYRGTVADFDAVARVKLRPYRTDQIITALVEAGLADDHGDGTYTIRGAEAHVLNIQAHRRMMHERAVSGGKSRAANAARVGGKFQPTTSHAPASNQPMAGAQPASTRIRDLDLVQGSNTANPPPAGAGFPPQGEPPAPLSLEGIQEAASREFEARGIVVTVEQAIALRQPGRDTETNARPTRQLEGFALAMLAELCDAASPPMVRPEAWDRQDHRNIAKLVGKYPTQEHWRRILTHYVTDARWAFLGGARPTKWLAEHIDDVAGRALGGDVMTVDPFAEGRAYAEECERKKREQSNQSGPEPRGDPDES